MLAVFTNPHSATWATLLQRPTLDTSNLENTVQEVLQAIRQNGDEAVRHYTSLFDKVDLAQIAVNTAEIQTAIHTLSPALKTAIHTAAANIRRFHETQQENTKVVETMQGVQCWRKSVGIEKVGLYIPGGTAPLFSTILMLGIPAQIAGCQEVVLCRPPDKQGTIHPAILYAAHYVGIQKIFKIGGVQAIGAMTFGTQTVP
ncbi:MAG: histidinol dehydrogenase, partial [Thermoflexibacteraceae bacterium]